MTSTNEPDDQPDPPDAEADSEAELKPVLDFLRVSRGFDFSVYKHNSLARRVRRRMQMVGIDGFAAYLDFLQVHPDEFPALFNAVLINVTSFFRDPLAWAALARGVEQLLAARAPDAPVRVWSAGTASGEEAYTLAMVLAEALGPEAFARRVKVYATDADEEALNQARLAQYPLKAADDIPAGLLEKYFTRTAAHLAVNKDLRRAVFFGRHDLLRDAPISRVDVLACRNTLMYFNAEAQARILNRFHFALVPDGVLMLGKAEMLLTHPSLFTPLDLKLRLFRRTNRGARTRLKPAVDGEATREAPAREPDAFLAQLHRAAFESSPVAQVILDGGNLLAAANQRARTLFGLTSADVGRPFQDLELSYRPAELRSRLDQVRVGRRAVSLKDVERVTAGGERQFFHVEVTPFVQDNGALSGAQVTFLDVSEEHRLQLDFRKLMQDLETAHEELQSTSEELETTNEELQSTVEELETTNEELQSTNEELETMNEEVQSSNEELQTMNEELRLRSDELNRANVFLEAVLASLRSGVAVLDRDLIVRAWNQPMEDLWGLRADEVEGKHFHSLNIGMPVESLRQALRASLAGDGERRELSLPCRNRRGKDIQCRVVVSALRSQTVQGVIVIVEEGSGPAGAA
ncbi:MAG: chemotaxis protein CheR [Myxococcaceae bacterium]|nr:chemotaxis protein CheR [Myxococcaceae bacterium]